jgi:hypothetical protein
MILSKFQTKGPSPKFRKLLKRKNNTNINACESFFASQCWYKFFKTLPGKLNRAHKKSKTRFNFFQLKLDFSQGFASKKCLSRFRRQNVTSFCESTARRLILPATGKGNLERRPSCMPRVELQIECRHRLPFPEIFSRVDVKNIRGSHRSRCSM